LPARIQLMQETAGGCFERGQVVEGIETTYRIGDEYIIFLVGGPKVFGRLAGASLAFRVRGGVVETRGFNGAPASMMMHEFKRVVERLLQ